MWVASGFGSNGNLLYSTDNGMEWTECGGTHLFDGGPGGNGVGANSVTNEWVAVGSNNSNLSNLYSQDGKNFVTRTVTRIPGISPQYIPILLGRLKMPDSGT